MPKPCLIFGKNYKFQNSRTYARTLSKFSKKIRKFETRERMFEFCLNFWKKLRKFETLGGGGCMPDPVRIFRKNCENSKLGSVCPDLVQIFRKNMKIRNSGAYVRTQSKFLEKIYENLNHRSVCPDPIQIYEKKTQKFETRERMSGSSWDAFSTIIKYLRM